MNDPTLTQALPVILLDDLPHMKQPSTSVSICSINKDAIIRREICFKHGNLREPPGNPLLHIQFLFSGIDGIPQFSKWTVKLLCIRNYMQTTFLQPAAALALCRCLINGYALLQC